MLCYRRKFVFQFVFMKLNGNNSGGVHTGQQDSCRISSSWKGTRCFHLHRKLYKKVTNETKTIKKRKTSDTNKFLAPAVFTVLESKRIFVTLYFSFSSPLEESHLTCRWIMYENMLCCLRDNFLTCHQNKTPSNKGSREVADTVYIYTQYTLCSLGLETGRRVLNEYKNHPELGLCIKLCDIKPSCNNSHLKWAITAGLFVTKKQQSWKTSHRNTILNAE